MSELKYAKVQPKPRLSTSQLVRPSLPFPSSKYNLYHPVFRDQLYKHLENVPQNDFDAFVSKLVQAGSSLELLKYADALFEIILVGGLLQPGGTYVDDGAPVSPFTILNAKEPVEIDEMKQYIEVLNRLIRRYYTLLSAPRLRSPHLIGTNTSRSHSKPPHCPVCCNTSIGGRRRRKTSSPSLLAC